MKILLLLLIPVFAFSQILSESFNNFHKKSYTNMTHCWIMDQAYLNAKSAGDSIHTDIITSGSIDFTHPNFSSHYASELNASDDIMYSGGQSLTFNGTNQTLLNDATAIASGTGNWSWEIIFKTGTSARHIVSNYKYSSQPFNDIALSSNKIQPYFRDANAHTNTTTLTASVTNNAWHHYVISANFTSNVLAGYLDGATDGTINISAFDATLTYSANDIAIGSLINASQFFAGRMVKVAYFTTALTANQVNELWALPENWYCLNYALKRSSAYGFYLGIGTDTTWAAIPDTVITTGYRPKLSFKYGTDGSTWTTKTASFTDNFSGDSLFFANDGTNLKAYYGSRAAMTLITTVTSGATVYVDDVQLTEELIPVQSTSDNNLYKRYIRWLRYRGY